MKFLITLIVALTALFSIPVKSEIVIDMEVPDENKDGKNGNNVANIEDIKPDIVHFKNKDKMHGKMVSIIPEKGLVWKSEMALGDINFKNEKINQIIRGNVAYAPSSGDSAVLLTNEDMIAGKLISLDENEVIIKTSYAGEIKINRKMVKSIFPGTDSGSVIFRGPNKTEEWTMPGNRNSRSSINVKDGELIINGYTSAGKDMELPDVSKVELEITSTGNHNFQIQLYGEKVDRYPRNGYVVYLSSGYVYFYRYNNGSSSSLGNFQANTLTNGKGKITVLSDKKKKTITVLINDTVSKTWTESSWSGKGGYLTFINQNNGTVKIKEILVSKWSGKLPGKTASESDKENDTIKFSNDDVVSGKLQSIIDGKVTFKTEYAEMNIPVERVKEIVTAMNDRHTARRRANDIKLFFESGDAITLELAKISNYEVQGESENFGKLNLKLNAFKKLQFNLYND
jgi:hypothetical protein